MITFGNDQEEKVVGSLESWSPGAVYRNAYKKLWFNYSI
jgi:hypothetical protein